MPDGSTMTLPPPSFVVNALEHLDLRPGRSFLDVGCGTGYVSALAACLLGNRAQGAIAGVECVGSRLEAARGNIKALRDRLALVAASAAAASASATLEVAEASGSSVAAVPSPVPLVAAPSCPSASALALAGTVLGDPHKALSCIDLTLSNVRGSRSRMQSHHSSDTLCHYPFLPPLRSWCPSAQKGQRLMPCTATPPCLRRISPCSCRCSSQGAKWSW